MEGRGRQWESWSPQGAAQLVGKDPEGRGEDPHGCGVWVSPSKLCGSRMRGSMAGPGDAQGGDKGPFYPCARSL